MPNQEISDEKKDQTQEPKEIGIMDPNFPLLKEFREKAPGSYKHAQSLAGIVENVAASIDLDPSVLKMAAMYHDVGKMWAPIYFTENQPDGENIHDNLDPIISYNLITKHVSDSVVILITNDFPVDVIKIVSQHHGTTVLKSFVEKMKNKDQIKNIRYKTPKPENIESMILMLCDTIEAASRSIYGSAEQSKISPDEIVTKLYNDLMLDGQFDEVSSKFGNLRKIQKTLISDVSANFHKRISYEEGEIVND